MARSESIHGNNLSNAFGKFRNVDREWIISDNSEISVFNNEQPRNLSRSREDVPLSASPIQSRNLSNAPTMPVSSTSDNEEDINGMRPENKEKINDMIVECKRLKADIILTQEKNCKRNTCTIGKVKNEITGSFPFDSL